MDVFPIRNDDDLARAYARVDDLWGSGPGSSQGDELDVLLALIEAYENAHHELSPGDPIDVVRYKLDELHMSQRELADRLGWGSGRVSEILNRKRELTLAMVRDLSAALGIPAGLLVGEEQARSNPDGNDDTLRLPRHLVRKVRDTAARSGCSAEAWVADLLSGALRGSESSEFARPTPSVAVSTADASCVGQSRSEGGAMTLPQGKQGVPA